MLGRCTALSRKAHRGLVLYFTRQRTFDRSQRGHDWTFLGAWGFLKITKQTLHRLFTSMLFPFSHLSQVLLHIVAHVERVTQPLGFLLAFLFQAS